MEGKRRFFLDWWKFFKKSWIIPCEKDT